MPIAQIQERIIATLAAEQGDISMTDLVERLRASQVSSAMAARAVLPLILVRRIEWTPERKLRLTDESKAVAHH